MESTAREDARDSLSPTCTFVFFDCLRSHDANGQPRKLGPQQGVEREMKIMYQQPHLVPPMKLTVYDELPATPGLPPPSAISRVVSQGRNLASRASERASFSIRRRPTRPRIGPPQLLPDGTEAPASCRRLELSIYLPNNRLSDLPEFDTASFTEEGSIKLPPKAVLRSARSEEALSAIARVPSTRRIASMCEDRTTSHARHDTASSIVSTSRPPSEYDALHSHPVSMISMPGMPPQVFHHPTNSITILSPIQQEFTPPTSAAMIDNMVMDFPKIDTKVQRQNLITESATQLLPTAPPVPAQAPIRFNFRSRTNSTSTQRSKRAGRSAGQSESRIEQWVHRANSSVSSYSTVSTLASASPSFSEHRRKKSQFYQCQPWTPEQQPPVELLPITEPQAPSPTRPFSPPKPLALHFKGHNRTRTMSSSTIGSTAETIDTNIMSLDDNISETTASTAPPPVIQDVRAVSSRASTVKSFSKPIVHSREVSSVRNAAGDRLTLPSSRPMTTDGMPAATLVEDLKHGMPVSPPYVAGLPEKHIGLVIQEVADPLRSPRVGVAF